MSQDSCDDENEQTSSPPATKNTQGSQRATNISYGDQEPAKPSYWSRLTTWNVAFNGILAVTTTFLGFIAYWQLDATNQAVSVSSSANKISGESLRISQESYRLSERTMKITERAWVMPKDAAIRGPVAISKIPVAKITLRNSGHSPALKIKVRHALAILQRPTLPDIPMPDIKITGNESLGALAPDGIAISEIALAAPLNKEQVARLVRKEWIIVTYGVIRYADTFEEMHETQFCLMWINIAGGAMSPCDKWNEAN